MKLIQTAQQLGEHKAQLSIGIFRNVECSVARWGIPQLLAKYEKALQIHFLDGVAQLQQNVTAEVRRLHAVNE